LLITWLLPVVAEQAQTLQALTILVVAVQVVIALHLELAVVVEAPNLH
jgi:hypothetical protein